MYKSLPIVLVGIGILGCVFILSFFLVYYVSSYREFNEIEGLYYISNYRAVESLLTDVVKQKEFKWRGRYFGYSSINKTYFSKYGLTINDVKILLPSLIEYDKYCKLIEKLFNHSNLQVYNFPIEEKHDEN